MCAQRLKDKLVFNSLASEIALPPASLFLTELQSSGFCSSINVFSGFSFLLRISYTLCLFLYKINSVCKHSKQTPEVQTHQFYQIYFIVGFKDSNLIQQCNQKKCILLLLPLQIWELENNRKKGVWLNSCGGISAFKRKKRDQCFLSAMCAHSKNIATCKSERGPLPGTHHPGTLISEFSPPEL